MKNVPTYVLVSLVLACVAACAAFRRAGYTAGGAGAGAVAGAVVGGPVGAGIGAAAGAVAANAVGENNELRDGTIIGRDALEDQLARQNDALKADNERQRLMIAELENRPAKTVEVEKPTPFVPTWMKWTLAIGTAFVLFWLKGHHMWRFVNGGGLPALSRVVLPSWAQPKP